MKRVKLNACVSTKDTPIHGYDTRDAYNAIAEPFACSRRFVWPECTNFAKRIKQNDRILDVGCGSGRLLDAFISKIIYYVGVDNAESVIVNAQKRYSDGFLPGLWNTQRIFLLADMTSLPFQNAVFDHVFAIASFHHLTTSERRAKALCEMYRVLRPRGFLFMMNWNFFRVLKGKTWWKSVTVSRLFKLDRNVWTIWQSNKKETPLYYYAFFRRELQTLVSKTGFHVQECYYSRKGKRASWFHGDNIVCIAQK